MLKFVKFLVGLLLLPLMAAVTTLFLSTIAEQRDWRVLELTTRWFIGGFTVWVLLFFLMPRPVQTYVLAHELTHALWGLVMGAKVSKLRVSSRGGSVTLTKTNMWITLAPYFFPFYSILALALYLLIARFWDMGPYVPFWYAVFGLTWAFHITFTLNMIGSHQPDIREHGRLFSYVVIYGINMLTAVVLAALLAGQPLSGLPGRLRDHTSTAYGTCRQWLQPGMAGLIREIEAMRQ